MTVPVILVSTIPPTGSKIVYIKRVKEINHSMTITERNQKLYELRQQLDKKRMELAWIETEIMAVNSQYDRENRETPLFEEMFGG